MERKDRNNQNKNIDISGRVISSESMHKDIPGEAWENNENEGVSQSPSAINDHRTDEKAVPGEGPQSFVNNTGKDFDSSKQMDADAPTS
jgi:hypothetical protein